MLIYVGVHAYDRWKAWHNDIVVTEVEIDDAQA
jgi:hypothetical protein